eukprot:8952184-Alexandrium_andersonii.AAC.1
MAAAHSATAPAGATAVLIPHVQATPWPRRAQARPSLDSPQAARGQCPGGGRGSPSPHGTQ